VTKQDPFFRVKKITDPSNFKLDDTIPVSDYLMTTEDNKVVQFEYVDPNARQDKKNEVTSGLYSLYVDKETHDIRHRPIIFNADKILKDYSYTEKIGSLVDKFFNKIHVYEKRDIFPKRAALLYGDPGLGKTSSIIDTVNKYMDGSTVAIVWPTATLRSSHVKEFFSESIFKDVKRLIFIIEDIGGGEKQYLGDKMPVDAELLSLLDNSNATFTIPTMILATTNYPSNLLEPILRTGRFDDLLEVPAPNSTQRSSLLKFFSEDLLATNEGILDEIQKTKYDKLSVSDLKEISLKAELDDTTMMTALTSLMERKRLVEEDFAKMKKAMGIHR
jgi:SpoVK/Ycf46/Vps4 family AAA+-type ATPase